MARRRRLSLSRTLIARLSAVALFLVLGGVAVVYVMKGRTRNGEAPVSKLDQVDDVLTEELPEVEDAADVEPELEVNKIPVASDGDEVSVNPAGFTSNVTSNVPSDAPSATDLPSDSNFVPSGIGNGQVEDSSSGFAPTDGAGQVQQFNPAIQSSETATSGDMDSPASQFQNSSFQPEPPPLQTPALQHSPPQQPTTSSNPLRSKDEDSGLPGSTSPGIDAPKIGLPDNEPTGSRFSPAPIEVNVPGVTNSGADESNPGDGQAGNRLPGTPNFNASNLLPQTSTPVPPTGGQVSDPASQFNQGTAGPTNSDPLPAGNQFSDGNLGQSFSPTPGGSLPSNSNFGGTPSAGGSLENSQALDSSAAENVPRALNPANSSFGESQGNTGADISQAAPAVGNSNFSSGGQPTGSLAGSGNQNLSGSGSQNFSSSSQTGGNNFADRGNFADSEFGAQSQPSFQSIPSSPSSFANQNNTATSQPQTSPLDPANSVAGQVPAVPDSSPSALATMQNDPRIEGVQTPSLTLQKIAPREIQINQQGQFELVIRNVGQTVANEVVVFDTVPAFIQLDSASPEPVSNTNGMLRWNLGDLAPGEAARIVLKLTPKSKGDAGQLGSVARVTFSAVAGARTRITQPRLAITHEGPTESLLGQPVALNIVVENQGDGPATNVVVQESIPDQLRFAAGNQREIEYVVGTLMPGQKRQVPLRLVAAQVGKFRNSVLAHADGDLKSQHSIDMQIVAPVVGVKADGHNRRLVGRPATHSFSVNNTGTAAATNIELVAKLPRGVRFQNANHLGQYNPTTHSVAWSLAQLEPGYSGTVELVTVPAVEGEQVIEFTATADLNQRESIQTSYTSYQVSELHFEIDDVDDAIEVGGIAAYSIRIVNQGAKAAANVNLTIDFPAGLTPIEIDGQPLPQGGGQQVRLPAIVRLQPQQQQRVVIRARAVAAGEHRIVASLTSSEREGAMKKEELTQVYADK